MRFVIRAVAIVLTLALSGCFYSLHELIPPGQGIAIPGAGPSGKLRIVKLDGAQTGEPEINTYQWVGDAYRLVNASGEGATVRITQLSGVGLVAQEEADDNRKTYIYALVAVEGDGALVLYENDCHRATDAELAQMHVVRDKDGMCLMETPEQLHQAMALLKGKGAAKMLRYERVK